MLSPSPPLSPPPPDTPQAASPDEQRRKMRQRYQSPLIYGSAALLTILLLSIGPPRSPVAPLGLSSLPAARTGSNAAAMLNEWDPEGDDRGSPSNSSSSTPAANPQAATSAPPPLLSPREQEKEQTLGVQDTVIPAGSSATATSAAAVHHHQISRTLVTARWILWIGIAYAALLGVIGQRAVQLASRFFRESVEQREKERDGPNHWRTRARRWMADHWRAAVWFAILGAVFDAAENVILLRMLQIWNGLESTALASLDLCATSAAVAFVLKTVFYGGALAYILYGWAVSVAYTSFRANIGGAIEAVRTVQVCLAAALIAALVVLIPDQSLEALRVLFEDASLPNHSGATLRVIFFLVGAVTLALTTGYWARNLLYLLLPEQSDDPPAQQWARRWLPRTCALLILTAISVALWRAAGPLDIAVSGEFAGSEEAGTRASMLLCAVAVLFIAVGIVALAFFRPGKPGRKTGLVMAGKKSSDGSRQQRPVSDLDTRERTLLILSTAIYAGLTLWLWGTRFQFAAYFGPMAVLLFALSGLVPLLAVLSYLGNNIKAPLTGILLGIAFLFSYYDLHDNHLIRSLPPQAAAAPAAASSSEGGDDTGVASFIASDDATLGDTFTAWLENRPDRQRYEDEHRPYPVVLVCAEGGGIRAAFQAGIALALLQDKNPNFRTHVFAISGVSGGSVGAATFAALATKADTVGEGQLPRGWWTHSTEEILSHDFLSPTVAALLFGETWQSIAPFPIPCADRARALEIGLENAWNDSANIQKLSGGSNGGGSSSGANPFSLSFYALGKNFAKRGVPALLMNTTREETGDRMIVSTIPLHPTPSREKSGTNRAGGLSSRVLRSLVTLADENPEQRPRLSTAAFLSARFSYVTPSGSVPLYQSDEAAASTASAANNGGTNPAPKSVYIGKKRYVDGGYFENSGAATLTDVFDSIQGGGGGGSDRRPAYRIIVLRIGYSYDPEAPGEIQYPAQGLDEFLAPPAALFKARDGRARVAVALLRARIENQRAVEIRQFREKESQTAKADTAQSAVAAYSGDYSEFVDLRFREEKVPLPLGWLLSAPARTELKNQMEHLTLTLQTGSPTASGQTAVATKPALDFVIDALTLPQAPTSVAAAAGTAPTQVAVSPAAPPAGSASARRHTSTAPKTEPRTARLRQQRSQQRRRRTRPAASSNTAGAGAMPSPQPSPSVGSGAVAETPSSPSSPPPTPAPELTPPATVAAANAPPQTTAQVTKPAENEALPPPVKGRPVPLP